MEGMLPTLVNSRAPVEANFSVRIGKQSILNNAHRVRRKVLIDGEPMSPLPPRNRLVNLLIGMSVANLVGGGLFFRAIKLFVAYKDPR